MRQARYRRVLLKISGESLKGSIDSGIDPLAVNYLSQQIGLAHGMGVELAVVIGGGNIWRGESAEMQGMDRATADYAGMLATLINALALQDGLERQDITTRTQSALQMQAVAESDENLMPYILNSVKAHATTGEISNTFREVFGEYRPKEIF